MRANLLAMVASGVLIWACAKANDTELLGHGQPLAGAGGSASGSGGRGGSNNAGTSSGSAGKGTGGKAGNSSGGSTNAQAGTGTSSGGSGGTNGNTGGNASGGTSGDDNPGGTMGMAGEDGIPPDVLARARVVLHYEARNRTSTNATAVEMRLFLENKTSDALPLDQVAVRYWMSHEPAQPMLFCHYAASVYGGGVELRYVDDGDDSHIEATFPNGGALRGPTTDLNSAEFQIKAEAGGGAFDQANDYSFDASFTASPAEPHDKITVYLANRLIWGCEPSGACPGTGEGGAGGEAGEAGQAGMSGSGVGGSSQGGDGGQGAEGGQGADGGQPASGGQGGAPGA